MYTTEIATMLEDPFWAPLSLPEKVMLYGMMERANHRLIYHSDAQNVISMPHLRCAEDCSLAAYQLYTSIMAGLYRSGHHGEYVISAASPGARGPRGAGASG